jgi:hypothetical protein
MRGILATVAEKRLFPASVSPRQTGLFGEWTIIPYQFPKSMSIAGNLTANQQFLRTLPMGNRREFRPGKLPFA